MATAVRKPKRPSKPAKRAGERFVFNEHIRIPANVTDFESFNQWCQSDDYPERGDVFWIGDTIWIEDEMEDIPTHALVKSELNRCLANLVKAWGTGLILPDGARLANEDARLSVEPDLMFVSYASVREGRIQLEPNEKKRILIVRGSPETVAEIASDSSGVKDSELEAKYFAAGVKEYWRIDARGEHLKFEILRRGPKGFVLTPRKNDFVKSTVFGRTFKLLMKPGPVGVPEFTLEVGE